MGILDEIGGAESLMVTNVVAVLSRNLFRHNFTSELRPSMIDLTVKEYYLI